MKVFGIINRYILKEIFPNYLVGVGFLSVILFVVQIFKMVRLFVERNTDFFLTIKVLFLYIPLILQITLPIGVILGVILAVSRLSDDSEIIAMRSCGVSLFKIFTPAIGFGFLMTLFILIFYQFILPFAVKQYAYTKIALYQTNPTAQLAKNLSYDTIDGIKITIDSVDPKTNQLVNVRINYINENRLIFAKNALLLSKNFEKNAFPLVLFNSTIYPSNLIDPDVSDRFNEQFNEKQIIYIPDRQFSELIPDGTQLLSLTELQKQLQKRSFSIALDNLRGYNQLKKSQIQALNKKQELDQILKNKPPKNSPQFQFYSTNVLNKKIEKKKLDILVKRFQRILKQSHLPEKRMPLIQDQYYYYRKLSFSFAALVFSILGAPLGIFSKRTGKSMGFGMSILLISLFFFFLFLGNILLKKYFFPPFLSSWLPNIVLFLLGSFFVFYRLNSWTSLSDMFKSLKFKFRSPQSPQSSSSSQSL